MCRFRHASFFIGCAAASIACATDRRTPLPELPEPPPDDTGPGLVGEPPAATPVPLPSPRANSQTWPNGVVFTRVQRPGQRLATAVVLFAASSADNPVDVVMAEALRRAVHDAGPPSVRVETFRTPEGLGLLFEATPVVLSSALDDFATILSAGPRSSDVEAARLRAMRDIADASRQWITVVTTVLRRQHYRPDDPRARDPREAVTVLGELTASEVPDLTRSRFSPHGTHVVVVEASEGARVRLDRLSKWRGDQVTSSRPTLGSESGARGSGMRFHVLSTGFEATSVFVLHFGPAPSSDDHPAFAALCEMMGGMVSEAARRFRHDRGSTYGVWSRLIDRDGSSECLWGGTFAEGAAVAAILQHRRQLEALHRGDFDAMSEAAGRGKVEGERLRRWTDPRELARWLAARRARGQDVAAILASWTRGPDVSGDRMKSVAAAYLRPYLLNFGVLLESRSVGLRIDRLGELLTYRLQISDHDP